MPVQIEGARRLRATLKAAGSDLSDLKAANRKAATITVPFAESLVPKRTGKLAASIRPGATKSAGVVRAGFKRVPYAGPIHWGWPARRITGQHFLTDGARNAEPFWIPIYEAEMHAAISKVQGK